MGMGHLALCGALFLALPGIEGPWGFSALLANGVSLEVKFRAGSSHRTFPMKPRGVNVVVLIFLLYSPPLFFCVFPSQAGPPEEELHYKPTHAVPLASARQQGGPPGEELGGGVPTCNLAFIFKKARPRRPPVTIDPIQWGVKKPEQFMNRKSQKNIVFLSSSKKRARWWSVQQWYPPVKAAEASSVATTVACESNRLNLPQSAGATAAFFRRPDCSAHANLP